MDDQVDLKYTHGTTGFLKGFEDNYHRLASNMVAVNMQTLIRNIFSDGAGTAQEALVKLGTEMRDLATDLSHIMNSIKHPDGPYVIYYLYDYDAMIPGDKLRPITGARAKVKEVVNLLVTNQHIYFKQREQSLGGYELRIFIRNTVGDPVKLFKFDLQELTINRTLALYTHQPIDMHVTSIMRNFAIVESHTGKILTAYDLPTKVFAKYGAIPFYPETHALLGDRYLLEPILSIKEKRVLLDVAVRENWKAHSWSQVTRRLRELDLLSKITRRK